MMEQVTFGDPARFAISVAWRDDPEPRERRPAHGGWSMGALGLTVGGHVLTRRRNQEGEDDAVHWYLLPVFAWLAENWVSLLHEERFSWRENSALPAAPATLRMLDRFIGASDARGRSTYAACRAWWERHALRAADSSALYPDVFLRRLTDDIEISWTARQPAYAPDGFRLALAPGAATLAVGEVAGPLWEALAWFASTAPAPLAEDRAAIERLEDRIGHLSRLPTDRLEAAYLPEGLLGSISDERRRSDTPDYGVRFSSAPAIEYLDDRVLMFGGVSPDIGTSDRRALLGLLAAQSHGHEAAALTIHVDTDIGAPLAIPFEEGYDLAEALLDDLALPGEATTVDVEAILEGWNVRVLDEPLETDTIRGVAVAGTRYGPAILVNGTSPYNKTEAGRRFTLAHELFHILYDRTRARRVAHTSGPWASPGVEKRANAFAAMLLMPRALVRRSLPDGPLTYEGIQAAADAMEVGASALLEHLHNIGLIDTITRDTLRLAS